VTKKRQSFAFESRMMCGWEII